MSCEKLTVLLIELQKRRCRDEGGGKTSKGQTASMHLYIPYFRPHFTA